MKILACISCAVGIGVIIYEGLTCKVKWKKDDGMDGEW